MGFFFFFQYDSETSHSIPRTSPTITESASEDQPDIYNERGRESSVSDIEMQNDNQDQLAVASNGNVSPKYTNQLTRFLTIISVTGPSTSLLGLFESCCGWHSSLSML